QTNGAQVALDEPARHTIGDGSGAARCRSRRAAHVVAPPQSATTRARQQSLRLVAELNAPRLICAGSAPALAQPKDEAEHTEHDGEDEARAPEESCDEGRA